MAEPTGFRPPDPSAEDAEDVLAALELTVTVRLSGLLHGEHRGMLPGTGSELSDTRPYVAGDDVRRIDWAATARSGEVQLRTTVEDRELTCYLVADATSSMDFGTRRSSKRQLAAAALASWGFLSARGANRVGGGVMGGGGDWHWYPPATGRVHLRALLADLLERPEEGRDGAGDLGAALESTGRLARHRGLVVVASDFSGAADTWREPLGVLAQRHDVVAVELYDPREEELADTGVTAFVDPETGQQVWVDTGSAKVRGAYAARRAQRRAETADAVAQAGAELVTLSTTGDWVDEIVVHLRRRRVAVGLTGARP